MAGYRAKNYLTRITIVIQMLIRSRREKRRQSDLYVQVRTFFEAFPECLSDFRGALEFNPIRTQDNFSQLFLRVFSLSRSPQGLLYAEFFFGPRRRRGKHALIYVRISIYVRCAPTAPRGSQAWTLQPPFVILMSHYIFV